MIIKTSIKSCCSSLVMIYTLDKPLRKHQLKPLFTNAGFAIPDNFYNSGLLYASKGGSNSVIISGSFGGTKFNVRGTNQTILAELDQLLEKAILIS